MVAWLVVRVQISYHDFSRFPTPFIDEPLAIIYHAWLGGCGRAKRHWPVRSLSKSPSTLNFASTSLDLLVSFSMRWDLALRYVVWSIETVPKVEAPRYKAMGVCFLAPMHAHRWRLSGCGHACMQCG